MEKITDNRTDQRYEISVEGQLAGFTQYRDRGDGVLEIFHTEVFQGWEGQGLGTRLLEGALADIRERGLKVIATCPMLAAHIQKRPEQHELLAS